MFHALQAQTQTAPSLAAIDKGWMMGLQESGMVASQDRSRGVVFFVDDEKSLVQIGCRMLGRLGFEARGFERGSAALAAFDKDPAAVDLVITDMTMPEMTGAVLVARLLALKPDLPIILCSGYGDGANDTSANPLSPSAYLSKPFTMGELAEAINALMTKGTPGAAGV